MVFKKESLTCADLIGAVQDQLPALYFVFSRGKSELLAEELGREWDFLLPEEKATVVRLISNAEAEHTGLFSGRRRILKNLLIQGIAYHHAGLSPGLKDLVERLYEVRLIFVLFCTETFALGINFPAASTIFDSTRKWDGRSHRGLLNREFFQMAGRAGRRGFDQVGRVFIKIDERYPEQTGFFSEKRVEPVHGRLVISPNTVLSLLHWKTDDEIKKFLSSNLAVYQQGQEAVRVSETLAAIGQKIARLEGVFCGDRDTAVCPMYRSLLKKEINRLKGRKRRNRPDTPARLARVRAELRETARKCLHHHCREAQKQAAVLNEEKDRLTRRLAYLQQHDLDYDKEFERMCRLLESLGYVQGRILLPRGLFALHLHVQELLVTEMVFSGLITESPPDLVASILAGVDYEPGRDEVVLAGRHSLVEAAGVRASLLEMGVPERLCVWSPLPGPLAEAWYGGASFETLLGRCNFHEGDVFSLLRREIDLLRQIERAAGDDHLLRDMINEIRRTLDRDEVAVMF
ncbi:MAG: helicase-related protein [Bacillota bacterium]|jgi:superfamily II RNA helicase